MYHNMTTLPSELFFDVFFFTCGVFFSNYHKVNMLLGTSGIVRIIELCHPSRAGPAITLMKFFSFTFYSSPHLLSDNAPTTMSVITFNNKQKKDS